MKMLSQLRAPFGFIGLAVTLILITTACGRSPYYLETMETLRKELGIKGDPLHHMTNSIKPGWSREEVRKLVRHHNRLEEWEGTITAPGGVDIFHYASRPGKDISGTRRIMVTYDKDQKVIDAVVWDL